MDKKARRAQLIAEMRAMNESTVSFIEIGRASCRERVFMMV